MNLGLNPSLNPNLILCLYWCLSLRYYCNPVNVGDEYALVCSCMYKHCALCYYSYYILSLYT
jgi:hypothetical protein